MHHEIGARSKYIMMVQGEIMLHKTSIELKCDSACELTRMMVTGERLW